MLFKVFTHRDGLGVRPDGVSPRYSKNLRFKVSFKDKYGILASVSFWPLSIIELVASAAPARFIIR